MLLNLLGKLLGPVGPQIVKSLFGAVAQWMVRRRIRNMLVDMCLDIASDILNEEGINIHKRKDLIKKYKKMVKKEVKVRTGAMFR